MSTKFFLLGGLILIVSGTLQVLVRPRDAKARGSRWIDASIVRAVMFVTMGVLALLVGTGVIPLQRWP